MDHIHYLYGSGSGCPCTGIENQFGRMWCFLVQKGFLSFISCIISILWRIFHRPGANWRIQNGFLQIRLALFLELHFDPGGLVIGFPVTGQAHILSGILVG